MSLRDKGVQKVKALWFKDADVIFQAGKKQFRVHRGILAARSPVFRDMFSMPQNSIDGESDSTIDKCTLIHLPDSPGDVHHFFLAIFDSSFFEPPPKTAHIKIVGGILHLSHKYDVEFLQRRATAHLNNMFETERIPAFLSYNSPDLDQVVPLWMASLSIIEPALAAGVRWIIPCLFLWSTVADLGTLLQSEHWKNLNPTLQRLYLIFREENLKDTHGMASWMFSLARDNCSTPVDCLRALQSLATRQDEVGKITECSFFQAKIKASENFKACFCPGCASRTVKLSYQALKNRWDRIPAHLGLPSWEILIKEKLAFEKTIQ